MSTNDLSIPFVYAGEVYAAAIVLPLIAIATVSLRFFMRISGPARIGPDDWITLAALVSQRSSRSSSQKPLTMICNQFPVLGMAICLIYGMFKQCETHVVCSDVSTRNIETCNWIFFAAISSPNESPTSGGAVRDNTTTEDRLHCKFDPHA